MIREYFRKLIFESDIVEELTARVSVKIDTMAQEKVERTVRDMQSKYSSFFFPDTSQELSKSTAADLLYLSPKDKVKIGGCSPKTCEIEMENAYVLANWDAKADLFRITTRNGLFRLEERTSPSSKTWNLSSTLKPHHDNIADATKDFLFHVCYSLRDDFVKKLKELDESKNSSWVDIDPDAAVADKMEDI